MGTIFNTPKDEINFHSFVKFPSFFQRLILVNLDLRDENLGLKDIFAHLARYVIFSICVLSYGYGLSYFVVNIIKFNNSIWISYAMTSFLLGSLTSKRTTWWTWQQYFDTFWYWSFNWNLSHLSSTTLRKTILKYCHGNNCPKPRATCSTNLLS